MTPKVTNGAVLVKEEKEDPTSAATGQERKRKWASEDDDDVVIVGKRYKKEVDFYLRELESELGNASKYARDGNKKFMEFCIKNATDHAQKAGALDAQFHQRVSQVRCHLQGERAFYLREIESDLGNASKYARDGNKTLMEFCIKNATENAQKAGALDAQFHQRVSQVRSHLKGERAFYLRAIESDLCNASKYAKDGNQKLMEFSIRSATENAQNAGALDFEFHQRVILVRSHLQGERAFYLREIESDLCYASNYAKDGNQKLMEFCIQNAKDYAKKAEGLVDNTFYARIASIRDELSGGNLASFVKEEPKIEMAHAKSHPQVASTGATGPIQSDALAGDSEVIMEKEMNVHQVIQDRVEKAKAKGDVLDLS